MICPTCKREPVADGRARCWFCLETELDAVKVNCEGRAKVTPYVPYDWTAKGQATHKRVIRKVYRVDGTDSTNAGTAALQGRSMGEGRHR